MSEYDFVIPHNKALKMSSESVFSMHDFYRVLRKWFDDHGYVMFEKEYVDKLGEAGKKGEIKWQPWKKVDDYVRFHIDFKVTFSDLKEVETKGGLLNKGEVGIKVVSYLEKDYENRWETNFMAKFLRSIYDYFIMKERFDTYKAELREESFDIFNEAKAFLGLHRFKK